jgi:hypothetical protein
MRKRATFWALAAVAWFVSHDAVFFAQLGPGAGLSRSLREAGHDYWAVAAGALLAIGALAAVLTTARIRRLETHARAVGARPTTSSPMPYLLRTARAWLALFTVVTLAFAVQENLEHLRTHAHLIGSGAVMGPEYPLALPVIALITLAAALLAAAVAGVERALVEAIAAARSNDGTRAPRQLYRAPARVAARTATPMAGASAGRAPPLRPASTPA